MTVSADFRKDFGSFSLRVNFEAGNEVLAITGGSGCGKSMTLKCIAGIVKPDRGRIVVDGVTFFDSERGVNLTPQKRRCGFLFQNYALFPNMTAKQNVTAAWRREKGVRGGREECWRELAGKFFITELANHYPDQLSGGQQQRVALARMLASGPAIIMLDEPLSALDSYLRRQLEQNLSGVLSGFSGTTLYVSHNHGEIYRLCDKVCVISGGKSEPVQSVADFFETPPTLAAAVLSGCENFSRVKDIGERCAAALDWNVNFECERVLPEGVKYIGVRANNIRLSENGGGAPNTFPAEIVSVRDDLFFTVVYLRPDGAPRGSAFSLIRAEIPKEKARQLTAGEKIYATAAPSDIMPLLP